MSLTVSPVSVAALPVAAVARAATAALFVALLGPVPVAAQETATEFDPARLVSAAREIMEAAGYCAMITVDADGVAHARTMDPFAPEPDLTIWFGTNPMSRKVAHIRRDPRVTLYYFDESTVSYVTLHGTARAVDDPAEKAARWKEGWQAFYPNRTDSYMLIEFSPSRIEVMSPPRQIIGESATWEVPAVDLDGG